MTTPPKPSGASSPLSEGQPLDVYGQIARNTVRAERDGTTTFPGQQNFGLVKMNPSSKIPPPTTASSNPSGTRST